MVSSWPSLSVLAWTVAVVLTPMLASPAAAQRCAQDTIAVRVDGELIRLRSTDTERLPYGRPLVVLVRVPDPVPTGVEVHYALRGGREGDRSGGVPAVATAEDPSCWAASIPAVHLNESGNIAALLFMRPTLSAGGRDMGFATRILIGLSRLPAEMTREEFEREVAAVATTASRAVFNEDTAALVLRRQRGAHVRLIDSLARMLPQDLPIANLPSTVRNAALQVAQVVDALLATYPTLDDVADSACRSGTTLRDIARTAADLRTASDSAIILALNGGRLPWSACAARVIDQALPTIRAGTDAAQRQRDSVLLIRARTGAESLATLPAARRLAAVVESISALTEVAVHVQTLSVGALEADLLERYTQLDVMSVAVPENGLVQSFAAATLYFSARGSPGELRIVQSAEPRGSERFGLQVGYPVGSAFRDPDTDFRPTLLTGIIVRLNALVSISGGLVFGRAEAASRSAGFISTNLDLSSLGPLEQLFSRPDR